MQSAHDVEAAPDRPWDSIQEWAGVAVEGAHGEAAHEIQHVEGSLSWDIREEEIHIQIVTEIRRRERGLWQWDAILSEYEYDDQYAVIST